ncbi:hypothetical protein [Streptomyces sp. NPDC093225]|uniref:hypothetical protein n=1 Tax=Streptomyces sp. NPDC093225 TaxID=3366034 RepID=UPI003819BEBD
MPVGSTDPVAPAEPTDPAAPTEPLRTRRRGRTALLIAAAAVLGVVAGTATGYAVQYDREPTPLPPLAQPGLRYAAPQPPTAATTVRSVNANRWHATEGDLRELLLRAPKGAVTVGPAYVPVDTYATEFEDAGYMLAHLLERDVRRIASTEWLVDGRRSVNVRLVQFRDYEAAEDHQESQSLYMSDEEHADNSGRAVRGVSQSNGLAWVYSEPKTKPGYLPMRYGRALARRGNVVLDIWVSDNRGTIAEWDVISLAERQLELL